MEQKEQQYIKYVAVYLRKSRGDEEKDLEKHKKVLIDLCVDNNWKYVLYEEIESGDSIAGRPVMQKLLKDVENDVYDAVLVIDIDRLGRGDKGDQNKIEKTFKNSETLIITDKGNYNLNNEDDEFIVDMRGFIARQEYKQIVKRLARGKKVGARLGNWTNGRPPFPYEYDASIKGLVVNEDKLPIYRFIIESVVLNNLTPNDIAYELNKKKIPSPKEGIWHGVSIYRLLVDETHLGKIISNKSKGDGHVKKKSDSEKVVKLPKSEWTIVDNCHKAVKTQEEHEKILLFLNRDKKTPKKSVAKKLALTGLIRCGKCGHGLGIQEREERNNNKIIKTCWYKDQYGNKCGNKGGSLDIVLHLIDSELDKYQAELEGKLNTSDDNSEEIKKLIDKQDKNIVSAQ